MVAVCQETYDESFFFEQPDNADYLRDHPLEIYVDHIIDLLDMDDNDYINQNAMKNTNLPNLLAAGTISQDEADEIERIIDGTIDLIGNPDPPRVHRDDILVYLEDNFYYYDWQPGNGYVRDTTLED